MSDPEIMDEDYSDPLGGAGARGDLMPSLSDRPRMTTLKGLLAKLEPSPE